MFIRKYIPLFLVLSAAVLLTACDALVAVPPAADADAPMSLSKEEMLALQPGDNIKLTVYGEETLTGKYRINSDGFISLPLLGNVKAAGLGKEELQTTIANLLKQEGYITNPNVTVDIDMMRPVYVMGEVRNPGKYEWQPSFTAFQAIASAGGYTPRAAQNKILIDRGQGESKAHLNANEETPVLPGDSITVRERIF